MDMDESIKNLDCYYSLEKLAERAGLTPEGLRNKLFELSYLDTNDRPAGRALQSHKSCYRFYDEDGHVDGEWLWHRDVLELLEDRPHKRRRHS
jgi:hypothetical protein